ncbi:diguanylate cyclase [Arhodomonas sp. SL1]|uniref:sensor domain-containing diguanylate cyclase n=1 Tax=Arhodomonas sp. SL1 TaxID=3425691 RepID=UPI003F880CE2
MNDVNADKLQDGAGRAYTEFFTRNAAPKLLIDPETGEIVDANPAAAGFYGWSVGELTGMRIQQINTLSEPEVRREMAFAEREHRRYFRFRHCIADGSVRDVEVYSGPIHVGGRRLLLSIIHDVSELHRQQEALEVYRDLFDALPLGVFRNTPGPDGRFLEVNQAMVEIFGANSVEILKDTAVSALYRDPAERADVDRELRATGCIKGRVLALRTLRGRPLFVQLTARLVTLPDGTEAFDGIVKDVTAEREAETFRGLLLEILDTTPDVVAMTDAGGGLLYMNRSGLELFGFGGHTDGDNREPPPTLRGMPLSELAPHPPWAQQQLRENVAPVARDKGLWRGESALRTPDGREIPVSQVIIAHYDEHGAVARYSTIIRDISEQKRLEAALAREATMDRLTGLYNRLRFEEVLVETLARCRRYGADAVLVMFDLDHFKAINDTFGHTTGDEVLRELAHRVRAEARDADLLARWGGEEFVAVLPDTDLEGGHIFAERLREAIAGTPFVGVGRVTISLGVTVLTGEDNPDSALRRVDRALYRAKRAGRDRVRVT